MMKFEEPLNELRSSNYNQNYLKSSNFLESELTPLTQISSWKLFKFYAQVVYIPFGIFEQHLLERGKRNFLLALS